MSTPITAADALQIGRKALSGIDRHLVPHPARAALYLLANFGIGLGWFIVLVTLLATGISLAITLTGIPILVATLYLWVAGARWERKRIASLSGQPVPAPYRPLEEDGSFFSRAYQRVTDPAVWRDLAYLISLMPLGIVELVIVLTAISLPITFITLPTYFWIGGGPELLGVWHVNTFPEATFGVLVGAVLILPMLLLISGTARAHIAFGRWLLGPSQEQLEERVEVLTRTRSSILEAMLAERRRIERDLHDGAQQRLVALAMDLGMARERFETDPQKAHQLVVDAHEEAKAALVELRELVRGFHPAILEDRGLDAALSAVVARSPVPVQLEVDVPRRPPSSVESAAYFVVSEALTNVARHSGATAARVSIARRGDRLAIDVTDNGRGGADPAAGTGLRGLEERVVSLGGWMQVLSPVGGPTSVLVELPCGS